MDGSDRGGRDGATREARVGLIGTQDEAGSLSGAPLVGAAWSCEALPRENRLLAALPRAARERLLGRAAEVELALKEQLWEVDAPIRDVYFPLNGVISMVSVMRDGSSVEVGTVGNEGFVGVPVLLGADRAPVRSFAQVPGVALRVEAAAFRAEVAESAPLRELLNRYTQALFAMIAQAAACNRVHPASQRLALWLLMCHDRVGADAFPITQEFIAQMLGVRRQTVDEEVGRLQAAGAIRQERGVLTVADRVALETAACECYAVIRAEYDRLLA